LIADFGKNCIPIIGLFSDRESVRREDTRGVKKNSVISFISSLCLPEFNPTLEKVHCMKLKRLELKNFRHFRESNIEFGKHLTVLVGVNGAGKTSVLDALAILISRLFARIRSPKAGGNFFANSDIRKGSNETASSIEVEFDRESFSWTLVKTRRGRRKQIATDLTDIRGIVGKIHDALDKNEKNSIPLAVFYGVNRSVLDVPLRIRTPREYDQFSAYDQALTGGRNDFHRFFEWYREREDFENEQRLYPAEKIIAEAILRQCLEYRDFQLQAVRNAIQALTDFSDLRVRRNPLRMEVRKGNQHFDVRQLSDGEKCLLALVGDLAHRLAIANPDMENPLEGQATVLIDEVDLHLHPEWQHRVIPKLLETFSNCQFILTTHSPQVLTHVRCGNIWCLIQNEKDVEAVRPDGTYGQDSNFLLKTLMRSSYRPENIDSDINRLFRLIRQDMTKARKLLNELESQVEGESPDLVRAQVLLHRREVMSQ